MRAASTARRPGPAGRRHLFALLAVLLIHLISLAGMAEAHPILQNAMWMEVTPERIAVRLEVSVRELCVVQGLPLSEDGSVDPDMAQDTAPRHAPYVLDHLDFQADGKGLAGRVTGIDSPSHIKPGAEGTDNSHFIYHIEYPLPVPPPVRITLTQTMVKEFPSAPGVPWDLSYAFRCGPPSNPMKNYGVLPRTSQIAFLTDGAMAVEQTSDPGTPDRLPPAQAALLALWAALGLNAASRRDALGIAGVAALSFFAGVLAAKTGAELPHFVLAALAGAGVMLTSVDNIHRPGVPADARRYALAGIFSLAAGMSATIQKTSPDATPSSSVGAFVLPAAVLFLLVTVVILQLRTNLSTDRIRGIRQLLSMACAVAGIIVLFHGLGIRPWDYWLGRQ